jgi:hypothetical protein
MGPVAFCREFPWLSNNVKFTKFGLANLKLCNFKVWAVLDLDGNDLNEI